ncbi:MAG: tyrosine-type recombinase/integrase [Lachnospiraceae bacterium]|nr:tyrosine-type recombinase/integrase [Lachnospiraceae bacterium]
MKRNIDSFLEYMVVIREASANTVAAYRRDLTRFSEDMAARGADTPDAVTEAMLADYFFALEKSDASQATLARNMSSVRAFFRFLVENDDVQRNITDILEQPKRRRNRPAVLTTEEIDRLLAAPDDGTPMGRRDRAILELLYASGLKAGELTQLFPDDIDLRAAIVRVPAAEGKKAREIPFGEKARDALLSWIGKGRDRYVPTFTEAPLFVNTRGTGLTRQSVWKIVKSYGEKAGIRREVTPGILRHSFAAHLMENGADARSLTRMMGFTAQAQTAIYEDDEGARLREVYARAQKRG